MTGPLAVEMAEEIRRLRAERNELARALADRNDEYTTVDAERARFATELGALDAQRAADQIAHKDLQAAYERLGNEAQRIVEAATQFRAERDRLHDALSEVLASGGQELDDGVMRGLRRTLWVTPERLQRWRDVLASVQRSEPTP